MTGHVQLSSGTGCHFWVMTVVGWVVSISWVLAVVVWKLGVDIWLWVVVVWLMGQHTDVLAKLLYLLKSKLGYKLGPAE